MGDLTPHDLAILDELYNLYSAFAEIKGPANTWDEVNALHNELCGFDGSNPLPGIAEQDVERLRIIGHSIVL